MYTDYFEGSYYMRKVHWIGKIRSYDLIKNFKSFEIMDTKRHVNDLVPKILRLNIPNKKKK